MAECERSLRWPPTVIVLEFERELSEKLEGAKTFSNNFAIPLLSITAKENNVSLSSPVNANVSMIV